LCEIGHGNQAHLRVLKSGKRRAAKPAFFHFRTKERYQMSTPSQIAANQTNAQQSTDRAPSKENASPAKIP
jgi:hypothetical protein